MIQTVCPFVYPHWRREQDRLREEAEEREREEYWRTHPRPQCQQTQQNGEWAPWYVFVLLFFIPFIVWITGKGIEKEWIEMERKENERMEKQRRREEWEKKERKRREEREVCQWKTE